MAQFYADYTKPGVIAKNCWIPVACMYCAKKHETSYCPENGKTVRPDFVPTCANYNGQHSANFAECEKLKEFMRIQAFLATKNSTRRRVTGNDKLNGLTFNAQRFSTSNYIPNGKSQQPTFTSVTRGHQTQ